MESLQYLNLIPHVLILVAAIQLVSKFSHAEGYLILIGAITSMLTSLFYTFAIKFLFADRDYTDMSQIYSIVGSISALGYVLFGVGFFLLVRRYIDLAQKK